MDGQPEATLSSQLHNFVFLITGFLLFIWFVRVTLRIRGLAELWVALERNNVVCVDDGFRSLGHPVRRSVEDIVAMRSAHKPEVVPTLSLRAHVKKETARLKVVEDNVELTFGVTAEDGQRIALRIYTGLVPQVLAKLGIKTEQKFKQEAISQRKQKGGKTSPPASPGIGASKTRKSSAPEVLTLGNSTAADRNEEKTEKEGKMGETLERNYAPLIPIPKSQYLEEFEFVRDSTTSVTLSIPSAAFLKGLESVRSRKVRSGAEKEQPALALVAFAEDAIDSDVVEITFLTLPDSLDLNLPAEQLLKAACSGSNLFDKQIVCYDGKILKVQELYLMSDEEKDCLICLADPKEIALLPCRHVCTCLECHTSINKCPMCRKPIDGYMHFTNYQITPDGPRPSPRMQQSEDEDAML